MTLYTLMLHRIHENGEIVPSEEAPDHQMLFSISGWRKNVSLNHLTGEFWTQIKIDL